MGHAILSPSSAHIWRYCAGYPLAVSHIISESTPETLEGDAAHELAEDVAGKLCYTGELPDFALYDGKFASNGVPFDRDMYDGAVMYAKVIHHYVRELKVMPELEKKIDATHVNPALYGTTDCEITNPREKLVIVDYKYGFKQVEAEGNDQEICYAVGAMHPLKGVVDQSFPVDLVIVAPRNFRSNPVKVWNTTVGELYQEERLLINQAAEAMQPGANLTPGSHCANCEMMLKCDANRQYTLSHIDFVATHSRFNDFTPEEVSIELNVLQPFLKILEKRVDTLEQHALSLLDKHARVPNYEKGYSRSRTIWNEDAETIKDTCALFEINPVKSEELKTPTQCKNEGLPETVIKNLSKEVSGSKKLVKTNIEPSKVFGKFKPDEVFKK